jgi:hypothetical protein
MRAPVCLCVCVSPLSTFECVNQSCSTYLGTLVSLGGVLPKTLSSVYVSVCVFSLIIARQRLGSHVPLAKNTCSNRSIVAGFVCYTVPVVPKESLWVYLCIPPVVARQWLGKHIPAATKNC